MFELDRSPGQESMPGGQTSTVSKKASKRQSDRYAYDTVEAYAHHAINSREDKVLAWMKIEYGHVVSVSTSDHGDRVPLRGGLESFPVNESCCLPSAFCRLCI